MRRAAAIVILICLPLCAAFGDIYRSIDAQGHVQYSDTPSPGAVLVSAADSTSGSSNATSDSSDSSATAASNGDAIHQQLQQEAAARAVQKDTEQIQAQRCKQAQAAYQQSIEARRIYKLDKDGTREYLTDDEAEQERVNDRLAMQAACKNN
jgi:RecA-family ATPase